MERIVMALGAAALLFASAGCGRDRVDANGIPLDQVPAGFQAKECHFEDIPNARNGPQRWQRLVCKHGAS